MLDGACQGTIAWAPCDHQPLVHQYFINEIEKLYVSAEKWSLVTIQEEAKDCHLYEKLGYVQRNILKEVNENMHFVLFVK